jgi:uncharacterized protein
MKPFLQSRVEMEEILKEETLGFLALSTPEGTPYVVPINYWYADGKILMHCALKGRKLDCIRAHPAVCFTVARQFGQVAPHDQGHCHLDSDSVICSGTARVVDDVEERHGLLQRFADGLADGERKVTPAEAQRCGVIEMTVETMTGRREREKKVTCWTHTFGA